MRCGIRLLSIPIFITSLITSFGFTNQIKSGSENLILFDACLQYVIAKDKAKLLSTQKEQFGLHKTELLEPWSSLASADTTTKNSTSPDSSKEDGISRKDSINNPILFPDTNKTNVIPQQELKILKSSSQPDTIKKDQSVPQDSIKSRISPEPDSTGGVQLPDTTSEGWIRSHLKETEKAEMTKADSIQLFAKQDSLRRIDSLAADSTARLKYFRAHRDDYYVVPFRSKKQSSFFVRPSNAYAARSVELDSTGTKVIIKETIAGKSEKILLEIPLDEYINQRLSTISRDVWEQMGYEYTLKDEKKDFGQLMTSLTNIQIPLPSSPLLSIFGKPGINLKISGAVDIHGAWRNETTEGVTTSALGNTRNEPDFKQQVQINLSGTIGDKLNISADWNTERQFQYENQLKIKYTGYDDEIVQNVEAGNVSLQASPLVGGSEALFGVKAQFKMGAFNLTALASQKKSEVQEVSVSGGSKAQKFEIHAYDYSPNHFFIDKEYADTTLNIFNDFFGNSPSIPHNDKYVKEIEVWKSYNALVSGKERKANAFIDLPPRVKGGPQYDSLTWRSTTIPTEVGRNEINISWIKLEAGTDYELHPETGFISFKTQIQDQDAIAVAYSDASGRYYGDFLKDLDTNATRLMVLKLVKPKNLQPSFTEAWKLQLRNIYPIGGRQVKEEGFTLDIKYLVPGQEPQSELNGIKLVTAFGLDKTDNSGNPTPDGAFDFTPNLTILPSTGEVIFPVLEPFGINYISSKLADTSLAYSSIYEKSLTFAKQDNTKDKYLITGEYSASSSSVYQIGFNVVENSVKVYLSGNLLKEGVDYTVDYNIGQIIIRRDDALTPGADLRITYEQNDLFQLASKNLLGLRGEYIVNPTTSIGFSLLNLNQQTLSDKVRIGEEPMNNSIYGVDFKTSLELPYITKGLDKLISTSTPSMLNLNAEYAYIQPDPNTKKSTVSSDNSRSIAYIDDFEGAKKTIPLGMTRGSWKDISVPFNLPFIGNEEKLAQMNYKAQMYWFNRIPSDITIDSIYGKRKQAAPNDAQIQVLDIVYNPNQRGFYNYAPVPNQQEKYWAGIMKALSSSANNLLEENIEFIEFWLKIENAPDGAKLNIDIGQISEDIIPNGQLNTEDKGDKGNNDLLDDGEDTGLDGVIGLAEVIDATNYPDDPANDNFEFTTGNYVRVNGTEGNKNDTEAGGLIPDTEDLNRNFALDNVNSYFSYQVPLDTSKIGDKYSNPFIAGVGQTGWYLFRIPLKDTVGIVGQPSLTVVETIRFWLNGPTQPVHLRFAEMNLVGNQWNKVLGIANSDSLKKDIVTIDDSVLTVSVVNFEDNEYYHMPPGVARERDKAQTDYEIYKNEQSLDLVLNNLRDGSRREIIKYLYQPLDVFNYKEMKMYIHADDNHILSNSIAHYVDSSNYATEVYLRFGSDTSNYYEYRQPLRPSTVEDQRNWSEISLVFSELTAIKQSRDSLEEKTVFSQEVPGLPGHYYSVKGKPTLTKVSFFIFGIKNPSGIGPTGDSVSGSIWINELRVLGADDTPGWAYSISGSFNLADLLTVSGNISQTNPYFHKLSDRFGSREDRLSWNVSVKLDVLKLIPLNLTGSNFTINYARSEQATNPLYVPGTDIKISEAQELKAAELQHLGADQQTINGAVNEIKRKAQTIGVTEKWDLSNFRIKIPTEAWYIRDIINNISLGFNYNKSTGRAPTIISQYSWSWNANLSYAVNLSRDLYFQPVNFPLVGEVFNFFSDYKDFKFYYLPQSFNATITASRKRSFSQSRNLLNENLLPKPTDLRDFTTARSAGFNWTLTEGGLLNLSLAYNFDIQSSLAHLITINEIERPESDIWSDIFGGALFGRDNNFRQSFDMRTNPKLPTLWDFNRYVSFTAGYSVGYNWQDDFEQEELGRSAGYSNKISTSLNIKLKSIFAPLFLEEKPSSIEQQTQPVGGRQGGRRSQRGQPRQNIQQPVNPEREQISDSTSVTDTTKKDILVDSLVTESTPGALSVSLKYMLLGIKWLLLDYDQIAINFSQSSSYAGGGLQGVGSGFKNFWGFTQDNYNGPSRAFMLGLSNDLGPRVAGTLSNNFTHRNDIDLKTSRPLWEGAQLDINWKVGWGFNRVEKFESDSLGRQVIINNTATGTIERSFLTLPGLPFFGNGMKQVIEEYRDPRKPKNAQNLSNAFLKGLETFSFLSKIPLLGNFVKYIPRPNWNLNWNGLEKYPLLNFAKRVSLQHAYSSTYSEGWNITPEGDQEIQQQRIDYGFSPLVGLSLQFDKFLGGSLSSTVRYSTRTSYSLGASTSNITEAFSRDISIQASYTKSGFELPLFGFYLKNDLEISFSYTSGKSSNVIFDMTNLTDEDGTPQDGKTNTTIEPKIKYVMSSRVTLSIFYRRTTIVPEGAARIPATTTNEAGVDVHISIQ